MFKQHDVVKVLAGSHVGQYGIVKGTSSGLVSVGVGGVQQSFLPEQLAKVGEDAPPEKYPVGATVLVPFTVDSVDSVYPGVTCHFPYRLIGDTDEDRTSFSVSERFLDALPRHEDSAVAARRLGIIRELYQWSQGQRAMPSGLGERCREELK